MFKSNLSIFINDVVYWTHVNTSGTVDAFFTIDFIEEGVDITAYELYCHHDGDEAAPEFIPFNIRDIVSNLVNKDVV